MRWIPVNDGGDNTGAFVDLEKVVKVTFHVQPDQLISAKLHVVNGDGELVSLGAVVHNETVEKLRVIIQGDSEPKP